MFCDASEIFGPVVPGDSRFAMEENRRWQRVHEKLSQVRFGNLNPAEISRIDNGHVGDDSERYHAKAWRCDAGCIKPTRPHPVHEAVVISYFEDLENVARVIIPVYGKYDPAAQLPEFLPRLLGAKVREHP